MVKIVKIIFIFNLIFQLLNYFPFELLDLERLEAVHGHHFYYSFCRHNSWIVIHTFFKKCRKFPRFPDIKAIRAGRSLFVSSKADIYSRPE